tara:strand:+ start:888 stop:1559 length:672 start_codon:yes stop_codon:yes gene_type:complete
MTDLKIREQDLVDNPTPRVPICLVLDSSYSMSGEPIDELNSGVELFFESVKNDEVAQWSAEICVVTFGGFAKKLLDFEGIQNQSIPTLSADGNTPMDDGVNMALDLLETRKREYSDRGVDYYQPWMVLMTDGEPTQDIASSVYRTVQMIDSKKLTIFPIAIGDGAHLHTLEQYSPSRKPLRLKGLNFSEFFEWLSQSISRVSQSTPGEKVELDVDGIKDWAVL